MRCDPARLALYLVTDRRMRPDLPLPELVRQAVAGGVTCVQLREKEIEGGEFYRLALAVGETLAGTGVPLIINDRVDVAAAVPCAGVHLGQKDLPLEAARRILGPDAVIGLSVNTPAEAVAAERAGADYLGAGPAFPTGTKLDTDPLLGPVSSTVGASLSVSRQQAHIPLPETECPELTARPSASFRWV